MSTIDWSKAPEDATHAVTGSVNCWRKQDGARWYMWVRGAWRQVAPYLAIYTARPAPWNGKDMPPIGTVCEMQDGIGVWTKVEIFASHCGFAHGWDADKRISYFSGDPREFRPIRTPKQIAAEETLRDIERLYVEGGPAALYDAGYRKFEIVDGEA